MKSSRSDAELILRDTFEDRKARGQVIGTRTSTGQMRDGIDLERVISIDHGALRIQPLVEAGWARACLSYGPFTSRAGLAMAVSILNGHNTSQAEELPEPLGARLQRWLRASGSTRLRYRVARALRVTRLLRLRRQLTRWFFAAKGRGWVHRLDENLGIGWFSSMVADPTRSGTAFVMHALGPENGELWVRIGGENVPVVGGVQNIHAWYVAVLRGDTTLYCAAFLPGSARDDVQPMLRPLGVDSSPPPRAVWACVHQSVLGQIGFRCDSRVHEVRVADVPEWASPFAGAQAADDFRGDGELDGSRDQLGLEWNVIHGSLSRSSQGLGPSALGGAACVTLPQPAGLLRCLLERPRDECGATSVWWRAAGPADRSELRVGFGQAELITLRQGIPDTLAREEMRTTGAMEIQVLDDGRQITVSINGHRMFGGPVAAHFGEAALGAGIAFSGKDCDLVRARLFEIHPRRIALPPVLSVRSPWSRLGRKTVVIDSFREGSGPLDAGRSGESAPLWQRTTGSGAFERAPAGVRVRADRNRPCPDRTVYTCEWASEDFADIEVTIIPPGHARGERHQGTAGLVVWQDRDNYMIVNNWISDVYDGASVSCFFMIDGWEDVYDAVWTNVGDRVRFGVPHRLRLATDGEHFVVFVDDEPVIVRSLADVYPECSPLNIRRVGIAANWEWGLDTGSRFLDFNGRI